MTDTNERRPRPGAAPNVVTATGSIVPHHGPTVLGLIYSPAGRRRRHLVLVESCHWCAGTHHHWAWLLPVKVMSRRCPVWGRRYWIRPTPVRDPGRRRKVVRHG